MTVRWRLTLVATIVFGVAFSAAAFGLVGAVRNSLEDGIEKTNQNQLDELAQQLQESANPAGLDLPGAEPRTKIPRPASGCSGSTAVRLRVVRSWRPSAASGT